MTSTIEKSQQIEQVIRQLDDVAVALSGGIDSLVLSAICFSLSQKADLKCTMYHAVSAAVPSQATERVRDCANRFGWTLRLVDANEFEDANYRENPVNRCFYCKSALYGTIRSATDAVILSGTNRDDLLEFRPGLKAAENFGVRHPFVEAGIDKSTIRELAPVYGISQYADLPAAPCLASRVETGISIEPDELRSINAIELFISAKYSCRTVRCRLRNGKVVIEIDENSLPEISSNIKQDESIEQEIRSLLATRFKNHPLDVTAYRTGSAFLQASK
ncbi:MAG TPA: hypothetical protein V6C89_09315 [Drouetiella sp.]|jgi:pyridinium-3,5-biscarboxylic acid mononucleotide sulfurtransferase